MVARYATHRDPQFTEITQRQVLELSKDKWYHSIQLQDGTIVPGVIGIDALVRRLQLIPIPGDLRGKRVLDVGAATGWFSFEMERRGAEVVAVDCVELEEFKEARRLLGSRVDYRTLDAEEVSPDRLGLFDYVLFLGVLYHLRHPLLGLEHVCAVTTEAAFVESFVTDPGFQTEQSQPVFEFYETTELGGQLDNWVGPNTACLLALCRSAGFARVALQYKEDRRAGVICLRRWTPPSAASPLLRPRLGSAVNNRTNDIYFSSWRDEYISLYFDSPEEGLTADTVLVEIDEWGARPLTVHPIGRGAWQANVRRPPGLARGPHSVRVRTLQSDFSHGFRIVVGEAHEQTGLDTSAHQATERDEPAPWLFAVENSRDGSKVFAGFKSEHLSCYFRTEAASLTKADVRVEAGGQACIVELLLEFGSHEWQVNAKLPPNILPGLHDVRVQTRSSRLSNPLQIRIAEQRPIRST